MSKYLLAFFLSACSCLPDSAAKQPEPPPRECYGPPGEFQGVKLALCQSSAEYVACAYVFLMQDAKVCWAVLAQPKNNCYQPFEYVTTQCAPKEEEQAPKIKKLNWDEDAHDEEFWDAEEV